MPQSPSCAGARRSRPSRPAGLDAATTRSASSAASSTRTPVARPRSVSTSSTCPTRRTIPGCAPPPPAGLVRRCSRRHRTPITTWSGLPSRSGPRSAAHPRRAGRSAPPAARPAALPPPARGRRADGGTVSPAAGPRAVGLRPGSRSTTVTSWPRRAKRHRREQPRRTRPDNDDPHSPLLGSIPENESAGSSTAMHRRRVVAAGWPAISRRS